VFRRGGLGARDTLRLEAALLLSGQDFHPTEEPRTPIEAGLAFAVAAEREETLASAPETTAAPRIDQASAARDPTLSWHELE